MQVIFSENALKSIHEFFHFYETMYFRLYDDTGLGPAEEIIKQSYHDSADSMRKGVYSELRVLMSQDNIFGYVPGDASSDIRLITKSYGSYRLFVEYREVDSYRIIENVHIYRK